jgi:hypothetical protein
MPALIKEPITEVCYGRPKEMGGGIIKIPCSTSSDIKRACLAKNADGVMIAYSVIDPGDLVNRKLSGASPETEGKIPAPETAEKCHIKQVQMGATITLNLGSNDKGKQIFLYLRWYNFKHPELSGPYGELITLLII